MFHVLTGPQSEGKERSPEERICSPLRSDFAFCCWIKQGNGSHFDT